MAKTRKKHIRWLFLLTLLVAGVAVALFWGHYRNFVSAPLTGFKDGQRFTVDKGNALPQVLRKLRAAGIQQGNDLEWRVLARQTDAAGRLQMGEYALRQDMTPGELLRDMRDGKVVSYRFTIVDGWNIRDLRKALARAEPLVHTVDGMTDAQMMAAIGHAGEHPEGRFLPETYQYNMVDNDVHVLKQAYTAMEKALAQAWESRVPGLPLQTPYQALTLASIVEKETGVAAERSKVAGVFVRRLNKGMRLETDPTVIYGMGEAYAGNIRKTDLQTDTPYNTYTRTGLPPTPIAMPGKAALQAVVKPDAGEAIFFVASGDGTGSSLYAATYEEHQANVRAYLARYRAGQAKGPMTGTTTTNVDDAAASQAQSQPTPPAAPAGSDAKGTPRP